MLGDEGLASLIEAAQANSPALAKAVARMDEARASAGQAVASASPQLSLNAATSRGDRNSQTGAIQTQHSATWQASWELDLFGRLRHQQAAAQMRLQASVLDAVATRLALQAQVADTVVQHRACAVQSQLRQADAASRQRSLQWTRLRQAVGQVAAMDSARAQSSLAESRGQLLATDLQCAQGLLRLANLSGRDVAQVAEELGRTQANLPQGLPEPPAIRAALPATVLAQHPAVLAATRNADAAFEDLGQAAAGQLPSLNLGLWLAQAWLGSAGVAARTATWSLGPNLSASLWDGGQAQAQTQAARARHAQALAQLDSTVRNALEEVETALAQFSNAQEREAHAMAAMQSAQALFDASEASQRAGRTSLFELEDARRNLNNAQLAWVQVRQARAQAFVALVKATGNPSSVAPHSLGHTS